MTLGQKIKERRLALGMTLQQIANHFGINRSAVSSWETDVNRPDSKKLKMLAQVLRMSVDELLLEGDSLSESGATAQDVAADFLPVRRGTLKLSAGVTGYAVEYENGESQPLFFRREWFERRRFNPAKLIALKVSGASMEPGLFDDDTVVINLADIQPIDGAVFAVNFEGELVIKRLLRDGGEWLLTSDNTDKRRFPHKKLTDGVQLIGRAVHKASEQI